MIKKIYFFIFLMLILKMPLNAQCCIKGENLLNRNNYDFSELFSVNPQGFKTDAIYSPVPAGGGYYYIISSRNWGACSSTPQYDHTSGDSTGKFLWYDTHYSVSASNPGIAWEPYDSLRAVGSENLIDVIPNSDYLFSAWIRNLARNSDCVSGIAPLVGLRINGADLAEIDLEVYTSPCCPEWKQICAIWNSGASTSALLQIESRRGMGFTDLGIDDVFFGKQDFIELGHDTVICENDVFQLNITTGFDSYLWNTGEISSSIIVNASGLYWVKAVSSCDTLCDSIRINAFPEKILDLGNDIVSCIDQVAVTLMPNTDFSDYLWNTGATTPDLNVNSSGTYILTVNNKCRNVTDTVNVTFKDCYCVFYLPNAFTPNEDGSNEEFKPICDCEITEYSLEIYNRWGELIYHSSDIGKGWNGTSKGHPVEQDVYVAKIIYKADKYYNQEKIIYSNVILIK